MLVLVAHQHPHIIATPIFEAELGFGDAVFAHTVELNLEPSEGASDFHERRHGPASVIVPAFVDELLTGKS